MASHIQLNATTKRISVIDALRGYALLGVLLTHYTSAFSGFPGLLTDEQLASLPFPALDHTIFLINQLFFKLKSRVLFSFLFGLGFYFQIKKSERLGIPFRKSFIKRLLVMLLFGLIHTYLIIWGDILRWYFVAGLFLLVLYRLDSKLILALCFLLTVVIPASESITEMMVTIHHETVFSPEYVQEAFLSGSYWQSIRLNFLIENERYTDPWYFIGYVSNILGFFFVGLWAGKVDLFKKLAEYETKIVWSFFIGILIFAAGTGMYLFNPISKTESLLWYQIIHSIGYRMNTLGLFMIYLTGFILIFQKTRLRTYLEVLVPVGKMTLTNYIMQSVVAVLIFNGVGLGLFGKVGPSFTLPIALAFFIVQIIFSHVWLHYYYTGPLEWLWRVMVSGKTQPLRKQAHHLVK
ncbi:MAG: DUF418 domain-containing protein [Cyclobacteriaceae bacterium]